MAGVSVIFRNVEARDKDVSDEPGDP